MTQTKQFIIILFILFSYSAIGQVQLDVNLEWNDIETIVIDENEQFSRLSFEGSDYETITGRIPYFSKLIPVSEFYEAYEVLIDNTVYENVNAIESNLIEERIGSLIDVKVERIQSADKKFIKIKFLPFISENQQLQKLISAQLHISNNGVLTRESKQNTYVDNSVLSSGLWYKIKISKSGVYKVTVAELAAMGFGSSIPTNEIRLYGNGGGLLNEKAGKRLYDDIVENAIEIIDENNNQLFDGNDYFIFYGQGPITWIYDKYNDLFTHRNHHYDDYAYYFITTKSGQGKRVNNMNSPTGNASFIVDQYLARSVYDNDSLNLIKSGKTWYSKKFDIITNYSFKFTFPNLNTDSALIIRSAAAARSFSSSNLSIFTNGVQNSISFSAVSNSTTSNYAHAVAKQLNIPISSSNINVQIAYNKPNNSSFAWLDYIILNAWSNLNMNGQQLIFSNPDAIKSSQIAKYELKSTSASLKIWDISNPIQPRKVVSTFTNSTHSFKAFTDTLRTYTAFTGGFLSVTNVGTVANQNLHALENIDYVIVTHPDFVSVANKLQTFHTDKSGYKVFVTTPDLIYNEFSSGAKDIAAIRDFMKMLYDNANNNGGIAPRYLLLLGDGSYDNKNRLDNNTNYILSFQSNNSLNPAGSFTSDDFFGILDDNEGQNASGTLDIGVGRFPVTTLEQAENILDKIYRYSETHTEGNTNNNSCTGGSINIENMADWRNVVAFVADDEDGMIHTSQANNLSVYVKDNYPAYVINKIYFDAYPQITVPGGQRYPDAKTDLLQQVEKGALIVSYTGHGGEVGWAHESVLEVGNINDMSNRNNLASFITATCEFSRFDDAERISAGEYVLLNPNGGGISLFTTTRLAFASSNYILSQGFFQSVFEKINGEYPAMGDVIKMAKVKSGSNPNNLNFILLGDPGLKLAYPKDEVMTTHINNHSVGTVVDTLKALSTVTIKGEVQRNGQLLNTFNGLVYPTIFDKAKSYYTLGNDPASYPYQFNLQKNILYKGKTEVVNGKFEFTFIVPKDIAYNYGFGKISYYAEDGNSDAHGAYDSIVIGGSNPNVVTDVLGPQITLFMNDSNFIFGGITNENPLLLAYVFDEHGINTTGNGIGHDIVAILDENSLNPIVLNDYYESELNSYQKGIVRYPFQNLSLGTHTLTIKVWDIYNNSSTARTEFVVSEAKQMVITELMNYPNPFTNFTSFVFEHNQACEVMQVELYIYNMVGQLVDKLEGTAQCDGYRLSSSLLTWDGTNSNGSPLSSGMYVYVMRVKTDETAWATSSNKMVIVR